QLLLLGLPFLVEALEPDERPLGVLVVVGKEDKRRMGGDAPGRTLRFVRKAGQDPVYRVEIDTSKFTTSFGDWIEKDLLKLSPWDVRRLGIEDYALVAVETNGRVGVTLDRKHRADLAYDDKDAKWSLVRLEGFNKEGKPEEEQLADGEELATTRLNDLRNALGDLKIVDVARKPSGLSAELKAEESFANDREAVTSMQQRGFLPLKTGDILSTDGETIVGMKDGVEYVLRFGATTTVSGDGKTGDKDGKAAEPGKDSAAETSGRYLLVMARFNEGLLEKPVLEPLPEAPAEDSKKDGDKKEEDKQDAAAEDKKPDAAENLKKADEAEAAAQVALENRRRVERENRRKQDEYDDKVKAAQKRVRDLNGRFADWYYVVSDKEYAKIHLTRNTMVQKSEAKPAAETSGAAPATEDK
ncbi:MAG: DUF4340 domain-containing protein, partial [Planctomycetia bacterium]